MGEAIVPRAKGDRRERWTLQMTDLLSSDSVKHPPMSFLILRERDGEIVPAPTRRSTSFTPGQEVKYNPGSNL